MSVIHSSWVLLGRRSALSDGTARCSTVRSIAEGRAASASTASPVHSRRPARGASRVVTCLVSWSVGLMSVLLVVSRFALLVSWPRGYRVQPRGEAGQEARRSPAQVRRDCAPPPGGFGGSGRTGELGMAEVAVSSIDWQRCWLRWARSWRPPCHVLMGVGGTAQCLGTKDLWFSRVERKDRTPRVVRPDLRPLDADTFHPFPPSGPSIVLGGWSSASRPFLILATPGNDGTVGSAGRHRHPPLSRILRSAPDPPQEPGRAYWRYAVPGHDRALHRSHPGAGAAARSARACRQRPGGGCRDRRGGRGWQDPTGRPAGCHRQRAGRAR